MTAILYHKKYSISICFLNIFDVRFALQEGTLNCKAVKKGETRNEKSTSSTRFLTGDADHGIEGHGEDLPKHMTIPINGALQMKIGLTGGGWGCYGFGNVEIK